LPWTKKISSYSPKTSYKSTIIAKGFDKPILEYDFIAILQHRKGGSLCVQKDGNNGKFIGKNISIFIRDREWREEINGGINGKKNMSPVNWEPSRVWLGSSYFLRLVPYFLNSPLSSITFSSLI
jgi:hypothetical protein